MDIKISDSNIRSSDPQLVSELSIVRLGPHGAFGWNYTVLSALALIKLAIFLNRIQQSITNCSAVGWTPRPAAQHFPICGKSIVNDSGDLYESSYMT